MLLVSIKNNFFKQFFPTVTLSDLCNSLDPDQDRHSGCPDLDPNCLPRLSTDGNFYSIQLNRFHFKFDLNSQ